VLTIWIFNTTVFGMPSLLSKNALYMWISALSLVENNFSPNVPHLLRVWDFLDILLIHIQRRIKYCTIHAYSKKLFFGPPLLSSFGKGEKCLFVNLKFYDLQMVRNNCARSNIEVSYKILWLEILNDVPILINSPCF
jgi:hypothetical protein